MANVSIREAVKHYDVSRPTLTKHLKSGKISGNQDGKGQWQIDPSELARVYQVRTELTGVLEDSKPGQTQRTLTTENTTSTNELEVLRDQLSEVKLRAIQAEARADAAEILAQERAERIEDLRRMLPPPDRKKKLRWWQRS